MKFIVITGLVPVIPMDWARCHGRRDARHKAGHDKERYPIPFTIARATSATVALRRSAGAEDSVK